MVCDQIYVKLFFFLGCIFKSLNNNLFCIFFQTTQNQSFSNSLGVPGFEDLGASFRSLYKNVIQPIREGRIAR